MGYVLAPAATQIDPVAVHVLVGDMEGALAGAAAAVVAGGGVDLDLAVHHLRHVDGTDFFNLADLAALALVPFHHGNPLAHDTQVVEVGLDAVVGAAATAILNLWGSFTSW